MSALKGDFLGVGISVPYNGWQMKMIHFHLERKGILQAVKASAEFRGLKKPRQSLPLTDQPLTAGKEALFN